MAVLIPAASPNPFPNALQSRRRSSSTTPSGSSFRSSLGGKPVGPRYTSASSRRDGSAGGSAVDGSAISESGESSGSGGEYAFSATREELRDGSARLASFSLLSSPSFGPTIVQSVPTLTAASLDTLSLSPRLQPPSTSALSRSPLHPSHAKTLGVSSSSNLTLARPSGITLRRPSTTTSAGPRADMGSSPEDDGPTPTQSTVGSLLSNVQAMERDGEGKVTVLGDETSGDGDAEGDDEGNEDEVREEREVGERTPLLSNGARAKVEGGTKFFEKVERRVGGWVSKARKEVGEVDLAALGPEALRAMPAVILGLLMNVLDGVSYGMIMFPSNVPVFADFGGIGVSMFFVSCLVSQLVYTGGGSIFKGGNGSMMIEVVPFFHVIVGIIAGSIDEGKSVVATTMVAFATSSILTGLTFFALGYMKLGSLSEFFPRHILVGCIGGVGAFLIVTGLSVSARLEESEGFTAKLLRHLFENEILPLWTIPLALAILLRFITSKYTHPLIFPGFFLAIPIVFYSIILSLGLSVQSLREAGWIFEVNGVDSEWYEYWTLYDFDKTDFGALVDTIPTQLALVFFGLLHVPINVPALGISVGEDDVDTDRELIAHGISNIASGMLGTVPNYLCYVNSVLFYKVGGDTRLSGFLLALATAGVLVVGPGVIGYLPVSVVGALIFILGLDLVKEAVWDTHGRVARFEYITIWSIIITMTVFDFVMGIGVGILLACVSFVVSSSQRKAIRSVLSGAVARSTVRRHPKQSAFLKEVGRQTRVIKLSGFLFFGTISSVEAAIRKILEAASWSHNPIRFLVLDFSMVPGVDFSAAEAFVRIQRLLEDKGVVLVLCGCSSESPVGLALRSVDLWAGGSEEGSVEVFANQNDALEYCENVFLRSLYAKAYDNPHTVTSSAPTSFSQMNLDSSMKETDSDLGVFEQSPRASHLRHAAKETMARVDTTAQVTNFQQPMPLLLQSLRPFSPALNEDICFRLAPYFKRLHVPRETVIWTRGSPGDSMYLIESGMLRASYLFLDQSHSICESMVAGTTAGELTFLSRTKRNATVVAERDSVLWKLDVEAHEQMGRSEGWAFCRALEECLLRIAGEEQEVLMGHLISSL